MAVQLDVFVNGNAAKDLDGISNNLKTLQTNYDTIKSKIKEVSDALESYKNQLKSLEESAKTSYGAEKASIETNISTRQSAIREMENELKILNSLTAARDGAALDKLTASYQNGLMTNKAYAEQVNKLADAHVAINGRVEEATATHEKLLGSYRNALITFDAAIGAVYGIKMAYDSTIGALVNFSAQMEMHRLAVGAIIIGNTANVTSTGQVIDSQTKMNMALKDTDSIMKNLQQAQRETHSSMGEMVSMYTQLSGAAMKLGMTYEQVTKLSVDFMNAGKVFDPTQTAMIPRMASEILNSTASSRDPLNQYLQIDQKVLESLGTAAEKYAYLESKLASVAQMARMTQDTFMGLSSNIVGDVQIIGQQAFAPIFNELKDDLKSIDDELWGNKDTIGKTLVEGGHLAAEAIHGISAAVKEITPVVEPVVEAFAIFAVGGAVETGFVSLTKVIGALPILIGTVGEALMVLGRTNPYLLALSTAAIAIGTAAQFVQPEKVGVSINGINKTPIGKGNYLSNSLEYVPTGSSTDLGGNSDDNYIYKAIEQSKQSRLVPLQTLNKQMTEEVDKYNKQAELIKNPNVNYEKALASLKTEQKGLIANYDGSPNMADQLQKNYESMQNVQLDMDTANAKRDAKAEAANRKAENEAKRHAAEIQKINEQITKDYETYNTFMSKQDAAQLSAEAKTASDISATYQKQLDNVAQIQADEIKLANGNQDKITAAQAEGQANRTKLYASWADAELKARDDYASKILAKYQEEYSFPDDLSKALYKAAMEYQKDYEALKGNLDAQAKLWEQYSKKTQGIQEDDAKKKEKLSDEMTIKLLEENRKLSDGILAETDKMYGSNETDKIDRWYVNQIDQLNKFALSIKDVTGHEAEISALFDKLEQIKNLKLEQTTLSFKVEDTFFKTFESSLADAISGAFNGRKFSFDTFVKGIEAALEKTLATSLAQSITGALQGTASGGISSLLGGSSIGSAFSIGNTLSTVYDLATGSSTLGTGALTTVNGALSSLAEAGTISTSTANTILTSASSVLDAFSVVAPYLAVGSLLYAGFSTTKKIDQTGLITANDLSTSSLLGTAHLENFQNYKTSSLFGGVSTNTTSQPIDAATREALLITFAGYDKLLKDLGASVTEMTVTAKEYGNQWADGQLTTEILPKEFLKNLMGLDKAFTPDGADQTALANKVYTAWSDYATNAKTTVQDAIDKAFQSVANTKQSIEALNLSFQGIDGNAIISTQNAISALNTAELQVSTLTGNFTAITMDNFSSMYDEILKTNPTPQTIQSFNDLGTAIVKMSGYAMSFNTAVEGYQGVSAGDSKFNMELARLQAENPTLYGNMSETDIRQFAVDHKDAIVKNIAAGLLSPLETAVFTDVFGTTGAKTNATTANTTMLIPSTSTLSGTQVVPVAPATAAAPITINTTPPATSTAAAVSPVVPTISTSNTSTASSNAINNAKIAATNNANYKGGLASILGSYDMGGEYWDKTKAMNYWGGSDSSTGSMDMTKTLNTFKDWETFVASGNASDAQKTYFASMKQSLTDYVSMLKTVSDSLVAMQTSLKGSIQTSKFDLYSSDPKTYAKYTSSVITPEQVNVAISKTKNETDLSKITQDATDAQTLANSYLQQQTTLINNSYQTQIAMLQVLTSLKDFAKQMWLADYSYLDATQKANVAQGYYVSDMAKLTAAVNSGDTANATKYSTAVQTDIPNYLKNLQKSGTDINSYKFAFDSVASQMTAVNNKLTDNGDTVESLTKKQTEAINDLKDKSIGKLQNISSALNYQEIGITTKLSEVAKALNITYIAPTINVYVDGTLKTTQIGQSTTTFSGTGSALQTAQSTSNAITPSQSLENYKSAYIKDMELWSSTPNKSLADEMRWLAQQIENQAKTNGLTGYDGYYQSVDSWFKGKGYATGGFVIGEGTGTSDSINARLSNGEYVATEQQVKQHPQLFSWLNQNRGYATGGMVNDVPLTAYPSEMEAKIVKLIDLTTTQNILLSQINNRQKRYENENAKAMSVTIVS